MRKPRDFDADLAALDQKARTLRQRKIMQLGELVIATGADQLPIDMLAGALLAAPATKDAETREAWRNAGAAMFQRKTENGSSAPRDLRNASASDDGAQSAGGKPRA